MKTNVLLALTLLSLLSACSTFPGYRSDPTDTSRAEASVLLARGSDKLEAEEAYISETGFFIKYRAGEHVLYSSAQREATFEGSSAVPVLDLKNHSKKPWKHTPGRTSTLNILSATQWEAFRAMVREAITPGDGEHGTVIDFLSEEEYFLYYDPDGRFKSVLIQDKPPGIKVKDSFSFDELIGVSLPILEGFLNQNEIKSRQVVFDTGDYGTYSYPFVYFNLDEGEVLFVRLIPEAHAFDRPFFEGRRAQTAGHLIRSHVGGVLLRPLSSLHRLFFLMTDTAVDTVRWTSLRNIQGDPIPPVSTGPGMDLEAWEKELDKLTGSRSSKGTIRYLVDGEEFFPRLIDAMTAAEDAIHLRTYIFDNDDYAVKIADILKKRSGDIKDVRVLLDGLGTIMATMADPEYLPMGREAPLSVRAYLSDDSDVKIRQATNPWFAGDHTKTTIIDHRLAFVGGMNIGREYRYEWHDLMMEVQGPVVDILQEEFSRSWANAGIFGDLGELAYRLRPNRKRAEDVGYPVRALFTRAGDSEIFGSQLAAIRSARSYIYIQNAYFADDAILYELAKARRRGVDVRVIIPLKGNHGLMNKSNTIAANAMLANGIRVFIYPGMSHIKAAVYDGWACLGSANFDKMSFRINKEINLATSHPEAVTRLLERVFLPDFEKSVELTEPFPEKWFDFLAETIADQF